MSSSTSDITQLLLAWSEGDQAALELLIPLIYEELRRRAHEFMRHERPGHSLQTTGLVNEVYLRLVDLKRVRWQNRAHFLAIAAQLMRQILVDFARSRRYVKRGGAACRVSLNEASLVSKGRSAEFVALDDALQSLAAIDPRKSQIVELRYFGGLSVKETAEVMNIAPRTVMREWNLARAWLHRELNNAGASNEPSLLRTQ
ncbi:MAG: sigma-70 family RNA polymerase sigma factor [Acidobacteria bacterium]|nr:sigma-70 family RNA polymerase sigma factor [Acidobacteriota bacterium]